MNAVEFLRKLRRYIAMKYDHARKRIIFMQMLVVIMRRPGDWLRRRRHAAAELPPALQPLYNRVERTGFAHVESVIDPICLDALQSLADARIADVRNAHATSISIRKDFWKSIVTADDLRDTSPMVAHALTPAVIDIVTAYLGEVPFLSRLELVVSRPYDNLSALAPRL